MFAKSLLAATFAGIAAAAPTTRDVTQYTMLSIRSGDPTVHQHPINFNNYRWTLDLSTTTFCPDTAPCSSYTNTTSVINAPDSGIILGTGEAGFQSAYVDAATGLLQYTEAHSDGIFPNDTYSGPFTIVDDQLKFEGQNFYACPITTTEGDETSYFLTAQSVATPGSGEEACKSIAISLDPYTGPVAFNYD